MEILIACAIAYLCPIRNVGPVTKTQGLRQKLTARTLRYGRRDVFCQLAIR